VAGNRHSSRNWILNGREIVQFERSISETKHSKAD
jgi:hypothetical protein